MSQPLFDKIAIIGIGLIGSSIARAARKHKLAKSIAIADASDEARKIAADLKLGDSYHAAPGDAVKDADLQQDPAILPKMLTVIESGTADLDIGSR